MPWISDTEIQQRELQIAKKTKSEVCVVTLMEVRFL